MSKPKYDEPIKVRRTKAYIVQMSKGDPIQIDEEELQKVIEGANAGELIVVKQGVINPSYMVDIRPDKERLRQWSRDCSYGLTQGEEANRIGIIPLRHIYSEGGTIGKMLKDSTKRLEASMPKQLSEPKKK